MNAIELMIGDYIMDKFDKTVHRISAIIKQDNGSVFIATEDGHIHQDCMYEFLPLLKIHLAKNGFKADKEDETFIYEDGYEVRISFDGGCKELELEPYIYLNINFAEKLLSKEIVYIHELQQAMRLMGCDKEIVL